MTKRVAHCAGDIVIVLPRSFAAAVDQTCYATHRSIYPLK